jgi:hypothetical protein
MAPANRPEILLLSLARYCSFFDETYSSLIDKLAESATVNCAKTVTGAIRYLGEHNPKAIIITDPGLIEDANAEVLPKVISYVQNGGIAIAGLYSPILCIRMSSIISSPLALSCLGNLGIIIVLSSNSIAPVSSLRVP